MEKKVSRFEVVWKDGSEMRSEGVRQILVDKETGCIISPGRADTARESRRFWIRKERSSSRKRSEKTFRNRHLVADNLSDFTEMIVCGFCLHCCLLYLRH